MLTAQKTVQKTVQDSSINTVEIDASQAYELVVKTTSSRTIDIKAVIEGEYKDDLLIKTSKNKAHFLIRTAFQPLFKDPNDKLSAHKVVSILLVVEVPENIDLIISGNRTNVNLNGLYKSINATVTDGNFTISNFNGSGEICNFDGNIAIKNYRGTIKTGTKYGKISGYHTPKEKQLLTLKTVNGNIYINKPK